MAPPADDEPTSTDASAEPPAPRVRAPAARVALRGFARSVGLVLTAIAIVVALAVGIPWLINLAW